MLEIGIGTTFFEENEGRMCIHTHCRAVYAYFKQPLAYLMNVCIILIETKQ